jgi:hypothetical protein
LALLRVLLNEVGVVALPVQLAKMEEEAQDSEAPFALAHWQKIKDSGNMS